jgi:hypothetical protein
MLVDLISLDMGQGALRRDIRPIRILQAVRPHHGSVHPPPRPVYATCYSSIVSSCISIATVVRERSPACLTEHECLPGYAKRDDFLVYGGSNAGGGETRP